MTTRHDQAVPCPIGEDKAPCPLHGGTMPILSPTPPGGPYSGDQVLDTGGTGRHRTGVCVVCHAKIMTNEEGTAIRTFPPGI